MDILHVQAISFMDRIDVVVFGRTWGLDQAYTTQPVAHFQVDLAWDDHATDHSSLACLVAEALLGELAHTDRDGP